MDLGITTTISLPEGSQEKDIDLEMRKILASLKIMIISSSLKKQLDNIKLVFEKTLSDLNITFCKFCTNESLFALAKEPVYKHKIFLKKIDREIKILQQWREKMGLLPPIKSIKIPQTIENPFEEGRLLPINSTGDYLALNRFYNTVYPILENVDHKYRKISGMLNALKERIDAEKAAIPEK